MAFEIRKVDRATFDAMWTPELREQFEDIIHSTENWINRVESKHWVIDDVTQASMLKVAMANRMDGATCYMLVQHGEYALIREVRWGTYSIAEMSVGFINRVSEVKKLATDALMLGGVWMTGNPESESTLALTTIPYVNFVEYVAPPTGD